MTKRDSFRGDLTNILAKKEPLVINLHVYDTPPNLKADQVVSSLSWSTLSLYIMFRTARMHAFQGDRAMYWLDIAQ